MKIKKSVFKKIIAESIVEDAGLDAMAIIDSIVSPYIEEQTAILEQVKSERTRPEDARVVLRLILMKSDEFVKELKRAILKK